MSRNIQTSATNRLNMYDAEWYALEPGDGTHYMFAFTELDQAEIHEGLYESLFPGTQPPGDYVGVLIAMSGWQGYYELRKDSILEGDRVENYYVSYVAGHMSNGAYPYTIKAVLYALRVLLIDPTDLAGACREMLRAREG